MKTSILALFAIVSASPAFADIQVDFIEGAPKDRFVISNTGDCDLGRSKLTIDLAGSTGRLIFDVTNQGQGVEVFQPFELVNGGEALAELPTVRDGDKSVVLDLLGLKAGNRISFTIDVDDTLGVREITVSNSEIAGAKVGFELSGKKTTGVFGDNSKAVLGIVECAS